MDIQWNNFLKDATNDYPYQIYCDMDGVLVDFIKPVVAEMNRAAINPYLGSKANELVRQAKLDLGRDYFVEDDIRIDHPIKSARDLMMLLISNNSMWWSGLPWAPGGRELWDHIRKYDPIILTTPMKNDLRSCSKGKVMWVRNNLKLPRNKIILTDKKYLWATSKGLPAVLIDDWSENTVPFVGSGGFSILHTTGKAKKTIYELEKIRDGKQKT